jgi:hypothetical protein
MSADLVARPKITTRHLSGPSDLLDRIFHSFGGPAALEPTYGFLQSATNDGPRAIFEFHVPILTAEVSLGGASSVVAIAGAAPRVVLAGNFLEESLACSLDALDQFVGDSSPLTCDAARLRALLLQFLAPSSHRALFSAEERVVAGLSDRYVSRARGLVQRGMKLLHGNLLFRDMTAGVVLAPFAYLIANRLFHMSPAASVPFTLLPPIVSYIHVVVSMSVTISSLAPEPEVRKRLMSYTQD